MDQISFSPVIAGVMTWGSWGKNLSTEQMAQRIGSYVDLGVTTFDHANIYGDYTTEEAFGQALCTSGVRRENIQLISKCGIELPNETRAVRTKHYDYSSEKLEACVNSSLKNLKTDYLDLLLLHRPSPLLDPNVVTETIDAFLRNGKIRAFGVSNFTPSGISVLQSRLEVQANQIQCSLTHFDAMFDGTLDYHMENEIITMAWAPLAKLSGLPSDRKERLGPVIGGLSEKYELTPEQLMVAWLSTHPAKIVPVLGTTSVERIEMAYHARSIQLETEDWFQLLEASRGFKVA